MEERSGRGAARRPVPGQAPSGAHVDRTLGDRLVEAGLLTHAQLDEVLEVHHTLAALAEPRWLGELLVTLRFVTVEQLLAYAPREYRAHLRRCADPRPNGPLMARLGDRLRRFLLPAGA